MVMDAHTPSPAPEVLGDDELLRIEMRIAQRADELWQNAGAHGGTDLIHWMRAEREVFGRYLEAGCPALAPAS
jgi:Protein of unknown function (DUF2934)